MKGILICGGSGTRLRPLTEVTNKSLLPVYDQPLIFYPLGNLINAGIKEIMVISGSEHVDQMAGFLGSGSKFDCRFTYRVQDEPKGIAHALGMAEEFAAGDNICAILGDNVFFDNIAKNIQSFTGGGHIFLKQVSDPQRFGIAEVQGDRVVSVEEKPQQPRSNLAQTGCYLYDNRCFEAIRTLQPSARGELEITDVTKWYLQNGALGYTILEDDWVDAGTFESLYEATTLVRAHKQKKAQQAAAPQAPAPAATTPPPAPTPSPAPAPVAPPTPAVPPVPPAPVPAPVPPPIPSPTPNPTPAPTPPAPAPAPATPPPAPTPPTPAAPPVPPAPVPAPAAPAPPPPTQNSAPPATPEWLKPPENPAAPAAQPIPQV